jgi:hypothetical protein
VSPPPAGDVEPEAPPPVEPAPVVLPPPGEKRTWMADVDGVVLSGEQATRALAFVNSASVRDLAEAGVYEDGIRLIVGHRPFPTLEAFGETKGIGRKTVEAVVSASGTALAAPVAEDGAVELDGVAFDADQAQRALAWVNESDRATLLAAGLYEDGADALLARRPFGSLAAVAATPLVGGTTMRQILDAVR